MSDIRPPAISMPSADDLRVTAQAVAQIKAFLQSPSQVASYLADIIRSGRVDTGGRLTVDEFAPEPDPVPVPAPAPFPILPGVVSDPPPEPVPVPLSAIALSLQTFAEEPLDCNIALSDGTLSTNGFGSDGAGLYLKTGEAWAKL